MRKRYADSSRDPPKTLDSQLLMVYISIHLVNNMETGSARASPQA